MPLRICLGANAGVSLNGRIMDVHQIRPLRAPITAGKPVRQLCRLCGIMTASHVHLSAWVRCVLVLCSPAGRERG